MTEQLKCDECAEVLFKAGERVGPGLYQEIDGHRQVRLDEDDFLPSGLDGHAATFVRVQNTWAQIHNPLLD